MIPGALFVLAALAMPAQAGQLELSNIRATQGVYGPARPDFRILPGEVLQVTFDIGGLQPDAVGRLRFAAKMSVEDAKGEALSKEDLGEMGPLLNVLGGAKIPHAIVVNTGLDQKPATYRVKVTVSDLNSKKEASFTQDFTIAALEFGLVRFQLCYDRFGQWPAPPVAVIGQTLFVNAVAIGYKYDSKDKKPPVAAVTVEMNLLDEKDKPTLAKPLTGDFKNLSADTPYLPFRFDLPVHRTGRFKLVLKATDEIGKKTANLTIPFTVMEVK